MREKLADLLARQNGYTSLHAMPASQRDNWRNRADAVLDALMEPTVDVEVAGDSAHDHAVPNALEIWKAMIQAAKEGK